MSVGRKRKGRPAHNEREPCVGYCPCGGKRQYPTKSRAKKALKMVNKGRHGDKPELTVYECRNCGFWHTSSHSYD